MEPLSIGPLPIPASNPLEIPPAVDIVRELKRPAEGVVDTTAERKAKREAAISALIGDRVPKLTQVRVNVHCAHLFIYEY